MTNQLARDEMGKLVASIDSIVKVFCRTDIFQRSKFVHDRTAEMLLEIGYLKIAMVNVTFQQLIQVGPKLVHQGLAKLKKNA